MPSWPETPTSSSGPKTWSAADDWFKLVTKMNSAEFRPSLKSKSRSNLRKERPWKKPDWSSQDLKRSNTGRRPLSSKSCRSRKAQLRRHPRIRALTPMSSHDCSSRSSQADKRKRQSTLGCRDGLPSLGRATKRMKATISPTTSSAKTARAARRVALRRPPIHLARVSLRSRRPRSSRRPASTNSNPPSGHCPSSATRTRKTWATWRTGTTATPSWPSERPWSSSSNPRRQSSHRTVTISLTSSTWKMHTVKRMGLLPRNPMSSWITVLDKESQLGRCSASLLARRPSRWRARLSIWALTALPAPSRKASWSRKPVEHTATPPTARPRNEHPWARFLNILKLELKS